MKDVLDAVTTRIKAPYFGYAVLAFIGWNWRGFFLLLATKGNPEQRLAVFDAHTTFESLYIAPLLTGILVAASAEWIRFGFEWIARKPRQLMSMMALDEEHEKIKKKLNLELLREKRDASQEEALIERAKREDQAAKDIESEEVRRRLQEDLERLREEKNKRSDIATSLNEYESEMLKAAAQVKDGSIMKLGYIGGEEIQIANVLYGSESPRVFARYDAALNNLIQKGLVAPKGSKGTYFQLTAMGWDVAEKLN